MPADETAVVESINALIQWLGGGVGGALLLAIVQAIIARVGNRQKEARERAEAEESAHDRRVERETSRADRAERGQRYHRARADRMHGNWIATLDVVSMLRRTAIDHEVPEEQLPQAPAPLPITDEETENAP